MIFLGITSVANPRLPGDVLLYPNPFSGLLSIDNQLPGKPALRLRTYDSAGKKMDDYFLEKEDNGIDFQHLPAGVYFIEIREPAAGFRSMKRVIKSKR